MLIFVKVCPVGDEFFHADRQTSGSTDMKKLTVGSRHFWNAPVKCAFLHIQHIYAFSTIRTIHSDYLPKSFT